MLRIGVAALKDGKRFESGGLEDELANADQRDVLAHEERIREREADESVEDAVGVGLLVADGEAIEGREAREDVVERDKARRLRVEAQRGEGPRHVAEEGNEVRGGRVLGEVEDVEGREVGDEVGSVR